MFISCKVISFIFSVLSRGWVASNPVYEKLSFVQDETESSGGKQPARKFFIFLAIEIKNERAFAKPHCFACFVIPL